MSALATALTGSLLLGAPPQGAAPAAGPSPAAAAPQDAPHWIHELEHPERRIAAVRELVRLGPAALPALHRALATARAEVVPSVLFACSGLAGDVESLREPMLRHWRGKDVGAALAARDALVALDGRGTTLVADHRASLVLDIDARGVATERARAAMVMGASRLPDDHLLLAAYEANRVLELDANGQEVWSFGGVDRPSDAERLPGGNTLIADSGHSRVVEVDPAGNEVWAFAKDVRPIDADRLGNGNTLIASYRASGAVEVDRAGKIVWQFRADNVRDADRLPDGTTLLTLTDERRVVRVDAGCNRVAEWPLSFAANDAELLPDGRLLAAGDGVVVELDADGRELWRAPVKFAGRVARLGARPEPPAKR